MAAALGTLGRLGIGSASPVTYGLDFKSEAFRLQQETINGNGVRGSRSHTLERVRAGLQRIGGAISLEPSAQDYAQLLPWILGSAAVVVSGTNRRYDINDALITQYLTVDRNAAVFSYTLAAVNQATFSAEQGEMLGVDLDLVGATETVAAAGTFPAIYPDVTTNPFVLSDVALSVNSTTVTAKSFELTVNNNVDKDRFFNSNTIAAMVGRDRSVMFKTRLPYGDWTALYNTGASTGVAVLISLAIGAVTMTISMPKVVFQPVSPVVEGRVEVMLDLEGRAFRYGTPTDTTKNELIFTLNTGV